MGAPWVSWGESNGTYNQLYVKHWLADGISMVDNNYGVRGNVLQVTISGSGFNGTPTASLIRTGSPTITSSNATQNNLYNFTYAFNLAGAAANVYDVQVTDANGCVSTLKQAFTVYSQIVSPIQWTINDIGTAGELTLPNGNCGLVIGDANQDNTQQIYVATQNQSLYQITKYSYGWTTPTALSVPATISYSQVVLADGNADQAWEAYGGALNNHVYQYIGPTWANPTDLGAGPAGATKICSLTRADVDNNGIMEIYAGGDNGIVSQFQNTGTGWCKIDLPHLSSVQVNSLAAGDGQNNFGTEIYSANADQKIFQYLYSGSAWTVSQVGFGTGAMNGVAVGDGDNDGQKEVYAACQDGKVYQCRWGTSWTCLPIGNPGSGPMNSVTIGDADNDGANEVYASCNDGFVYEYKKTSVSTWTTLKLSNVIGNTGTGTPLYALAIGDADNDGHMEVYSLGQNNHVFQFQPGSIPTPTATIIPVTPTPAASATQTPFSTDKYFKIFHSQINPIHGESARIRWAQPQDAPTTITIYNLLGDKIITLVDHQHYASGQFHEVNWKGVSASGKVVGSGIYIVLLKTDGYEIYSKCAVVK
jgi:hypothetical protein